MLNGKTLSPGTCGIGGYKMSLAFAISGCNFPLNDVIDEMNNNIPDPTAVPV